MVDASEDFYDDVNALDKVIQENAEKAQKRVLLVFSHASNPASGLKEGDVVSNSGDTQDLVVTKEVIQSYLKSASYSALKKELAHVGFDIDVTIEATLLMDESQFINSIDAAGVLSTDKGLFKLSMMFSTLYQEKAA